MPAVYVFDACSLIALLNRETGGEGKAIVALAGMSEEGIERLSRKTRQACANIVAVMRPTQEERVGLDTWSNRQ